MDSDALDSTHTLVHTDTQTVMDNDPTVCNVETPIRTMSPTVDHSSSPGPHLPFDPTACGDQALIYTLSHNGCSVRELQQSDTEIEQVLAWLEEGQRPPRWRLKDAVRGLKRLWHEFLQLTDCCVGCMADGTNNTNCGRCCLGRRGPQTPSWHDFDGSPCLRVVNGARGVCYWPTVYSDVNAWCGQSYACQRRRSPVP